MALKYCGGCDPTYDRVEYWEMVKARAGSRIAWVSLDTPDFEAVLLINGCQRACAGTSLEPGLRQPVLSITSDALCPRQVVETLLK
ncbi:MAG: hypothetical protein JRI95_03225 [Deltaproteobacteria bacterium]|nr:hypothetical protein [Deltaproteobacteria bacterium]MBW2086468.1 hypothetical protein [Deltaproteobacteria bacterium]